VLWQAQLTAENVGMKLALDDKLVEDIKVWGYPSGQEVSERNEELVPRLSRLPRN
jgi:hypothetical protein